MFWADLIRLRVERMKIITWNIFLFEGKISEAYTATRGYFVHLREYFIDMGLSINHVIGSNGQRVSQKVTSGHINGE